MTSRERVLKVINGEVPDSVPRGLYDVAINAYNDSTIELFQKKMGKHPRDCFRQDLRGIWPKAACTVNDTEEEVERRARLLPDISCSADVEEVFANLNFDDYQLGSVQKDIENIKADGYPAIFCGAGRS